MPESLVSTVGLDPETTVLVVDDTEANRYAITRHLRSEGCRIAEATNGADGLALAQSLLPDLVILDVRMPNLSGFEVTQRLRADEHTADIPILHISASFTDPDSKVQGLDNGADGYLTHPIEPQVLLATVRSLLRTRRAERHARATARAWRATFDAIGEGVCVIDATGAILRCNRAFAELVGEPYGALLGRGLDHLVPQARLSSTPPFVAFEENETGAVGPVELGGRWFRTSVEPVGNESGDIIEAVAVFADVSRQREADERVRQAQQLEIAGRLAGGVAHEINNMMTIILGYSAFVLQRIPLGDRSQSDLEEIYRAATRAADIARQLLTFSRRQVVRPTVFDAGSLVSDMQRTIRQLLGADRELRARIGAGPMRVRADRGQLEQVLVNLTLNARDAMPSGGTLTLRVGSAYLDAAFAERYPGVDIEQGRYVEFVVEDTGHGMDAETLAHAFEPFFTTKEVGAGSGLGLATVYGIVKQANGYVWATSEPGHGTIVSLYLPMTDERTEAEAVAAALPEGLFGTETVLVVEDEPAVRALARRSLEIVGYTVLEAVSGGEAVERLREYGNCIRLVLTDIVMPGMSGPALAKHVRAAQPQMPVLFMTGYTDEEIASRRLLTAEEQVIQKPFQPRVLAMRVRETLEASPRSRSGSRSAD